MSSLVLLNNEGIVARKLQFVSPPDDYVVPEGMTLSWRISLSLKSFLSSVQKVYCSREPIEAYFYLGSARGQVCCSKEDVRKKHAGPVHYYSRILTVTVQGTSVKDVMVLRDHIMHLINSGARWGVSNDLNPKPRKSFLQKIIGK